MTNLFTLENVADFSEKINIDDLYERKRRLDLNKLELFKKILNRIHVRIKTSARMDAHKKCCWFVVPEFIIGVPKYDHPCCIAFVMDELLKNGFLVRYMHPNTLFIAWHHWVPSYVRNEIKQKTGITINEYGQKIEDPEEEGEDEGEIKEPHHRAPPSTNLQQIPNSKKYTPIQSYKPSGKLVYDEELFDHLNQKINH